MADVHPAGKGEKTLKRSRGIIIALQIALTLGTLASAQDVVTIGAIISVTGSSSFRGEVQKKSALLLQDLINNRGGIYGRKLKIVVYDDESDVNTCLLAAEKMLSWEQVAAVIGPTTSGNTLAVSGMFEKARIPLLSLAGSEKIVTPPKRWVFKIPPSSRQASMKALTHAKSSGIRKIAMITSLTGAGQEARDAVKSIAPGMGISLVADELLSRGERDVTARLERIMVAGAQAILCWTADIQASAVAKNMAELEIGIPLYAGPQAASKRFIELSGKAAEGTLLPVERVSLFKQVGDGDTRKELMFDYYREYESRYKTPSPPPGAYVRDAIMIIEKAIREKGSTYPPDIRDSLEEMGSFPGLGGVYDYSPGDHSGLDWRNFELVRVEKGRFKTVR